MPALAKVLIIFAAIVLFNRLKVDLGLSILAGTLMLGLWFGQGLPLTIREMAVSTLDPLTLMMTLLVVLILVMNRLMELSGGQKAMLESLSRLIKDPRKTLTALPALIGLLPMPGGAYFSAPMVEGVSAGLSLKPERKTLINYWFRHIWEFWWPMYPGVILAVSLTGWALTRFMLVQGVYTLVAVAIGAVFLLRGISRVSSTATAESGLSWKSLISPTLPISIILVFVILGGAASSLWEGRLVPRGQMAQYVPMFIGLFTAIVIVLVKGRLGFGAVVSSIFNKKVSSLMLLVLSIMAYKTVLNHSGAIGMISVELKTYHIPVAVVVMALPFISGLVVGVAVGFVGASFPLVLSLIAGSPHVTSYITLAYCFGYLGMMLSPIHFCLVLTSDYFKAGYGPIYRVLLPICALMAAFTLLWAFLLR